MANTISWGKSVENLLQTNPVKLIETESNQFVLLENGYLLIDETSIGEYNGFGKVYDNTNWGDPITL